MPPADPILSVGDPIEVAQPVYSSETGTVNDEWVPGAVYYVGETDFGVVFKDNTRIGIRFDGPIEWRIP